MITEYHRPQTLEEALKLISRPKTFPLGGGTMLNQAATEQFAVVDLQALGLDKIHKTGNTLEIGAAATISLLLESPHISPALGTALRLEAPLNLRNLGTVAGTLVTCDGRSPFAAALLAMDARLVTAPDDQVLVLGDFLPFRAEPRPSPFLITRIDIPLNAQLAFETVARTPADKPIVCAALAQWPSGRTRLALGGRGDSPTLAMDGNEPGDVEAAARNAYAEAGDAWASAEYRSDVAAVLAKRCLEKLAR